MKNTKNKEKRVLVVVIIVIIIIFISIIFKSLFIQKEICGPKDAGKSHSLDYCDKSCNTDENCKFVCGCGAININEECDKGNMEIKCIANFPVKCENKECVVGEIIQDLEIGNIIYPEISKGIMLELNIKDDKLILLESQLVSSYPNYLPGSYHFVAKLFSSSEELSAEYGFGDPRIVLCEEGCDPPVIEDVNFTLILPYFPDTETIRIYSAEKEELKINISENNSQEECSGSCRCMEKCNEQGPTYFIPSEEGYLECSINSINKICCCSGV